MAGKGLGRNAVGCQSVGCGELDALEFRRLMMGVLSEGGDWDLRATFRTIISLDAGSCSTITVHENQQLQRACDKFRVRLGKDEFAAMLAGGAVSEEDYLCILKRSPWF